jgi:LacI family kdg operon repressor
LGGSSLERLTISDIASLANVSIATVSNYLNGNYKKMSLKTRTHLEQIINQTNYRPNGTARSLAKNENKTIGVSIADITNPFTSSVLSGIYKVCDEHGYKVLFTNADNNQQSEINNILRLRSENVAGFIIDPVNANGPIYKSFSNNSTVIVDRQAVKTKIDTIVTDNNHSVYQMIRKMMAKGYQDLFFVSWPLDAVSTRTLRYHGFLDATGYTEGSHLITVPHLGEKKLYDQFNQQIKEIMESHRDHKPAFFTMNARVFIRLLQAMQLANYNYPDDYGLATYEEFEWMKTMRPQISCIQQDSRELGVEAAALLIDKLENPQESFEPSIKIVPTKLVINNSF